MSVYKLYLHFEGSQTLPDFTYIYKTNRKSSDNVGQLVQKFCSAYKCKHSAELASTDVRLACDGGRVPHTEEAVIKAFTSGSDVQVTNTHLAGSASEPVQAKRTFQPPRNLDQLAADLQLSSSSPSVTQHTEVKACRDAGVSSSALPSHELLCADDKQVYLPIIRQFLDRAKEAESKKYFRAACKIYEQVCRPDTQPWLCHKLSSGKVSRLECSIGLKMLLASRF